VFRAYNEGIAYRFETSFSGPLRIIDETSEFNFAANYQTIFPEEFSFVSHFEQEYKWLALDSLASGRFCYLPAVIVADHGVRLAITETDLYDYPAMFLAGTKPNGLKGIYPPVVLETVPGQNADRNEIITRKADYIAETTGSRTFPWRIMMVARHDMELIENQMPYLLARPQKIDHTDWIKPGKVAWDWWNALNIYGVDFRAGINTQTYKYYIDFASYYGLSYVILDEGWSPTTDILHPVPSIDLEEIIRYGREKNVGVILWVLWKPLDRDMENILEQYASWGVKGVKVDFMQRADQYMVNYYERVARFAAQNNLLVDFHGAFKPAGLERAYPNVMSYEGLRGLEHCKWSERITPDHDLILPFTRMLAGPMDYTPGAMINTGRDNFRIVFTEPMSQGTRCHQAAMYVIYESPLQMLADNPSNYLREPEYTSFISRIPVTWDELRTIDGKIGDYLVLARRHGSDWYLAAMTDWDPRTFTINLSFLGEGSYMLEALEDGINADRHAGDYRIRREEVTKSSSLMLSLAGGGGWVGRISKMAANDAKQHP
jgi:alpha-glucosidase